MPSLKAFRNRITSVKATRKITRAMQMVAASKLKRAQDAAQAARPYAERMAAVISSLAGSMTGNPGAPRLLTGTGSDRVHLVIVATADRGLCGGFNTNIVRRARLLIDALLNEGKEVKIFCVGRKGRDQLRRLYSRYIIDTVELTGVKRLAFSDALGIARRVLDMYAEGQFDLATIVYARFKSVISQEPTAQRLIPAPVEIAPQGAPAAGGAVYDYEPDEAEILADLLPRNVAVQIFRALLENAASEQGARMSAMDSATRNAGEVIDRLTLQYNRSRQAMITKELIEIISGAEAI
ncbi:MAG: F-type H+-transporting ATPase subunit gamma [Alphaproteobacteria bacterium]|jgi:F-type H+-transporting ATPase subunit gamma|nr:F-type H+-transporting ATPase subunit gamma [Alphaproteobacteria bacterium]